ncbi:MAG: hypothetical protein U0572_07345 [Phycisphaerales bacterium]
MRQRRGFVMIAVLVIVGCAVLVATGIVFLVRGEVAGTTNSTDSLRMRSAAWSAVQAVAARCASQRDRLLIGGAPSLESSFALWEYPDETATALLLPIGPDGERLVAEAARVDLRSATADSLVATGAVSEDLATRVIAARDALGGGAVLPESLLFGRSAAISPEDLYGPLDDVQLALDEDADVRSGAALERLLSGGSSPRGLADLLTGFAEEPSIASDGRRRVALAGAWDDERRNAVDALLGEGSAIVLEKASKEATDESALFAAWRSKHPDPKEWPVFLDGTALDDAPSRLGRLDLLRAGPAALRSLPGIDDERAARILRERDALPEDARRTTSWLVERSILTPEEFTAIVGRLTTRSFFWRVRVGVKLAPAHLRADAEDSGRAAVFEAVIDLSEPTPRIAMLRDVGSLETIAQLLGAAAPQTTDAAPDAPNDIASPALGPPPAAPPPSDEPPAAAEPGDEASDHASKPALSAGRWRRTRAPAE